MNATTDLNRDALNRTRNLCGDSYIEGMRHLFLVHGPQLLESALAAEKEGNREVVERAAYSLELIANRLGVVSIEALAGEVLRATGPDRHYEVLHLLRLIERAYQRVKDDVADSTRRGI